LGFRQSAIFKLTPVGGGQWTESVVNPVSGPADSGFFYDGVVIDRFENLHGATVHGGETDDGCVYKFTPGNNNNFGNSFGARRIPENIDL